jgi:hypothetical protein
MPAANLLCSNQKSLHSTVEFSFPDFAAVRQLTRIAQDYALSRSNAPAEQSGTGRLV